MASTLDKAMNLLSKADLYTTVYVPAASNEFQEHFDTQKAEKFLMYFIPFIKGCKDKPTFRDSMRIELKKVSLEDKRWLFEKLKKQIEYEEKLSLN